MTERESWSGPWASAAEALAAFGQMPEWPRGTGSPAAVLLAQLESMSVEVSERREQVRSLISQLSAFDEQLAILESSLAPILTWSRAWVRLLENASDPFRWSTAQDDAASDTP